MVQKFRLGERIFTKVTRRIPAQILEKPVQEVFKPFYRGPKYVNPPSTLGAPSSALPEFEILTQPRRDAWRHRQHHFMSRQTYQQRYVPTFKESQFLSDRLQARTSYRRPLYEPRWRLSERISTRVTRRNPQPRPTPLVPYIERPREKWKPFPVWDDPTHFCRPMLVYRHGKKIWTTTCNIQSPKRPKTYFAGRRPAYNPRRRYRRYY